MADRALKGATETADLFDALPAAARYELADMLGRIGRDFQAAQLARVPRDSGDLASQIEVQLLTEQLRVRVGLIGPKSKAKFYGRIVEFGRKAQTVVVQRRRVGATKLLRNRRKRAEDIAATYALKVRAAAPRPFVLLPEAEQDAIAAQRLADFWANTFSRAGV